MVHIRDVIFAPSMGAFFYDDQAAIRAGLDHDGFDYDGAPQTPGFTRVRQPAEALSIGLALDVEPYAGATWSVFNILARRAEILCLTRKRWPGLLKRW